MPPDDMKPWTENGFQAKFAALSERVIAILARMDDLKMWTAKHETEEFAYHERVSKHMEETRVHITAAQEGRQQHAQRLTAIEVDLLNLRATSLEQFSALRWRIAIAVGGITVIVVVVLPILAYLASALLSHLITETP